VPEQDDYDTGLLDESRVPVAKVLLAEGETMVYVYDLGDKWRHQVALEKIIPSAATPALQISLDNAAHLPHNGKQMAKGDNLGEFEQLILTALMILGENAYGMTIHEQMEKLASGLRPVSLGAVYTTLDRLEKKGYVRSWFGGATEERGGRSKRFFEITGSGELAVKNALKVASNMLRELGYA
jgi:DNA-binding PadR family transcriptional regulator